MWITAQLQVKRSRTWLTLCTGVSLAALLGLWFYPPWPQGGYWVSAAASGLVLALTLQGWRQGLMLSGQLELQPNGRLRLRLKDTNQEGTFQAQLSGSAGISGLCCRFSLSALGSEPLPRAWRQVVLFRDSLSEAEYRALCRWLAQHPRR